MVVLTLTTGCVAVREPDRKSSSQVEAQAGRLVAEYSISIDADYDPRLDDLIPGYKLLPVSFRNMSLRSIPMDVKRDRWVVVGEKGKRYRAVNSLRVKDPKIWRELPEDLRSLIDYPELVPINYSVTFDLLLPKKANLDYFREIRYTSVPLGLEFVIEKEY